MKARGTGAGGGGEAAEAVRPESVSEFTRRVKQLLETSFGAVWIRGEVSNLRTQASGHVYFSLKDAGAQLSAVMFRGDALRQTVKLRDGLQVIVYGEVSVYEARGQYQIIVRVAVDEGVGRLQREFEALKARLAAEGLFAPERKVAIPAMPRTVGFITSPTGAAVQDFARIVMRRGWRGRVVVLPAKMSRKGGPLRQTLRVSCARATWATDSPARTPNAQQALMIPAKIATHTPLKNENSLIVACFCSSESSRSFDMPAAPQSTMAIVHTRTPARVIAPERLARISPKVPS